MEENSFKMTIAIATLLEKYPFSEDDSLVHGDWIYHWIGEMIQFEGSGETGSCILPLGHGCRALSNILRIPRCEDFVHADCRLYIIYAIVEALEHIPERGVNDLEDVGQTVNDHEDVGQTILHCCMGVPTLPFQQVLVAAIHALWEPNQNHRTLAWTFWWTQWLSSLLDKGLWTTKLVLECNGIANLVLLSQTWRSNDTIEKDVLHILTRLRDNMLTTCLNDLHTLTRFNTDIRTLLGQKDAMAIPEGVPLSVVDEDNRLTILARVPPRQEGAPDDHA